MTSLLPARGSAEVYLGAFGRASAELHADVVPLLARGLDGVFPSQATTICGSGRSSSSSSSGVPSGTSSHSGREAPRSSCGGPCPARSGSRRRRSTTRSERWPIRPPESRSSRSARTVSVATLTFAELLTEVGAAAAGLRRLGITRGDRVAAVLPNCPEAVVALLATASLGAVWTSCSPRIRPRRPVGPLSQVEPSVLITVDGYHYGGKAFGTAERAIALRDILPSVEHLVVVDVLGSPLPAGAIGWPDLVAEPAEARFEPLPFDAPLWILFSSGTTGPPKAIVHGARGHRGHDPQGSRDPARAPPGRAVLSPGDPDLGDVEHPRLVAAHRRNLRPLRRAPAPPRCRRPVAACRPRRRDELRGGRGLDRGLPPQRRGADGDRRSPAPSTRLRRPAHRSGLRGTAGSTTGSAPTCTWRRIAAAADAPAGRCWGAAPRCPVRAGRDPVPPARGALRGLGRGRTVARRRGRRARGDRADARDAARPLERPRRSAVAGDLLRPLPRSLAPRRRGAHHGDGGRRRLRSLGCDVESRRRSHGDGRVLRRPGDGSRESGTRWWSTRARPAPVAS